jgi:hypothetical protein
LETRKEKRDGGGQQMLESIQKLASWISNLPPVPKITMTVVVVLTCFVLLYVVWVPPPTKNPANETSVKDAYARMQRVLARLDGSGDHITVDGVPIEPRLNHYYKTYLIIATYVSANPGNIKGAYEKIWEHGGQSRTFIDDTGAFEAVVSAFIREWDEVARKKKE